MIGLLVLLAFVAATAWYCWPPAESKFSKDWRSPEPPVEPYWHVCLHDPCTLRDGHDGPHKFPTLEPS